jgi:hypothetical protein
MTQLKYLQIRKEADGAIRAFVLPSAINTVITDDREEISAEVLLNYWTSRHMPPFKPSLAQLLKPRLQNYQLSPTHLNSFTNLISGGPASFFIYSLLRFPKAPSLEHNYGTAIHHTLRWIGNYFRRHQKRPSKVRVLNFYEKQLAAIPLISEDFILLRDRGRLALDAWYQQRIKSFGLNDKYEINFAKEGVFLDDVRLGGKIDRLNINEKARSINIIDYKTGKAYNRWQRNILKLHQYRQQLLTYKLLVERSASFKGYRVDKILIEFIEPDEEGRIIQLELISDENEMQRHIKLLKAVWDHIMNLDFPDVSKYPPTIKGILKFEDELIDEVKN